MNCTSPRVAIVWRSDREVRRTATPQNNRYHRIFEELSAAGITSEPAVFDEDFAGEVLDQLLQVDATLVWVNPLDDLKTQVVLDDLLRKVTETGGFVSAHPDVIQEKDVKEVHHASSVGRTVPGLERPYGTGMDASHDVNARHRSRILADYLGYRLPVWTVARQLA